MKRLILAAAMLTAIGAWPQLAGASGDYGCSPNWSLAVSSYDCAGTAMLGPRNDTRVNLALLSRDRARISTPSPVSYPRWDWDTAEFGHVLLDWDSLQAAFWPRPQVSAADIGDDAPPYSGSRCQTLASGGQAFRAALAGAKGLQPGEAEALSAARERVKPACDGDTSSATWPTVSSAASQAWLAYLQGARAFYADDFATARTRFADLMRARDPWLAETARYMVARNELAAAQVGAFDEWGGYAGSDKVDRPSAERARTALRDYISAFPRGRYTASAIGLTRRAAWLLGDGATLARAYSGLLADPSQSPAVLEEVETKVFFGTGIADTADAPLLLATWDLLRMRQANPDPYTSNEPPTAITPEELARQAPVFAKQADLYGFLQASLAFHVARDYRRVLALIPDDARAKSFTPLAFSRQMLRGLALDKTGDRNAAAFFQQVAGNAKDLYQQPAAQLALALHWERSGELARVFASASPVTEPEIRTILLARVAGPELLRRQAGVPAPVERNVAAFTLLTKALSRGQYASFGADLAKLPSSNAVSGSVGEGWSSAWMNPDPDSMPPAGLFTRGKFQEDYPCPALARTAATLATTPTNSKARLCLGEFWRLNGFDDYLGATHEAGADQLGGTADLFPGKPIPRASLYAAVLADRAAAPDDTAYALYRAVRCYAPSRINGCGGADVPEAQRKAWFQRLKRDYPGSRWAGALAYYW